MPALESIGALRAGHLGGDGAAGADGLIGVVERVGGAPDLCATAPETVYTPLEYEADPASPTLPTALLLQPLGRDVEPVVVVGVLVVVGAVVVRCRCLVVWDVARWAWRLAWPLKAVAETFTFPVFTARAGAAGLEDPVGDGDAPGVVFGDPVVGKPTNSPQPQPTA